MARYKHYDYTQRVMIAVNLQSQLVPGSFEHAVHTLIEEKLDLSAFDACYKNDETGAPAYDPAILLKVILCAYARGITSSRSIERLCCEHVIFMALAAHQAPHFSTLAEFISSRHEPIEKLFREVLLVCDEAGLIGRQMFAVDGVKLPSNASKEWSGTKVELGQKAAKIEQAVKVLTERHRQADANPLDEQDAARAQQIATLEQAQRKIEAFLAQHEDKQGVSGKAKKSNVTDNESAKMKTSKGVIQGYDGLAVVDEQHQIVVAAQAFGQGQEHDLLIPMLEVTRENFQAIGQETDVLKQAAVSADAGFYTQDNVKYAAEQQIDAYLADNQFRQRDPRFAGAAKHKPERGSTAKHFQPKDFYHDQEAGICICPAGEFLYRNGVRCNLGGREAVRFTGAKRVCGGCPLRAQCLRDPKHTTVRQVTFFTGKKYYAKPKLEHVEQMKGKIDSEQGRYQYGKRLATVEPVFANITSTKGLRRFSHRGRKKVNTQWLLYCMVHNLEKVQRYGDYAAKTKQ